MEFNFFHWEYPTHDTTLLYYIAEINSNSPTKKVATSINEHQVQ
jgi:hypothetical protein